MSAFKYHENSFSSTIKMQVFTLGYQGLTLETYTETILAAGVGLLIDVREVPWSYNRKYIKSVLECTMSSADVGYLHLKECGNPSANRKSAASIEECLARYSAYLEANTDCLDTLSIHIRSAYEAGKPACLTCFEKHPYECHRSILLNQLSKRMPELSVTHLIVSNVKTVVVRDLSAGTTSQHNREGVRVTFNIAQEKSQGISVQIADLFQL